MNLVHGHTVPSSHKKPYWTMRGMNKQPRGCEIMKRRWKFMIIRPCLLVLFVTVMALCLVLRAVNLQSASSQRETRFYYDEGTYLLLLCWFQSWFVHSISSSVFFFPSQCNLIARSDFSLKKYFVLRSKSKKVICDMLYTSW
jgi:hypothetical protein